MVRRTARMLKLGLSARGSGMPTLLGVILWQALITAPGGQHVAILLVVPMAHLQYQYYPCLRSAVQRG